MVKIYMTIIQYLKVVLIIYEIKITQTKLFLYFLANQLLIIRAKLVQIIYRNSTLNMLYSLLASGEFCRLLLIFANSLDVDHARLNVGPDLDPNRLRL